MKSQFLNQNFSLCDTLAHSTSKLKANFQKSAEETHICSMYKPFSV